MGGFGRIIGAVIGGILGYLIPGVGWAIGFAIGGLVGGLLDPGAKVSSPGIPRQQLQITTNEIGIPIPDLVGTGKITGIFLAYGKEHSKKQYSKSSGGKGGMFGGGSKKQVTGYKYYMSWVQAICLGPVDTLYAIYQDNDTLLWEGELNCPATTGVETITVSKLGRIDFYFGTDDHALNTNIGALLDDPTLNTPWRGLCYAFMSDCYIGTYNRCPSLHFMVRKAPVISSLSAGTIQEYDYNPINAIWYILHNLTGLPESWLHTADFASAALTIANEARGVSILFDQQQGALNYLQNINDHIDNIIQYGSDGKFHPKLIRDDYVSASLPLVDEDAFLEDPSLSRPSWIDTVNEVKVQYSEITNVSRIPVSGNLYGWGAIGYEDGEGGPPKTSPFKIGSDTEWADVSRGYYSFSAGKDDGTLWLAGWMDWLGNYLLTPTQITTQMPGVTVSTVMDYSRGANQDVMIKGDGTMWAYGDNSLGQLGQGNTNVYNTWVQMGSDDDWIKCRSGYNHILALKSDGTLWTTGHTYFGNQAWNVLTQIPGLYMEISAGYYYSFALDVLGITYGGLWVVGANAGNQGVATPGTKFAMEPCIGPGAACIDFSAPLLVTLCIDIYGALWATGKLWGPTAGSVDWTKLSDGPFVKCAGGWYRGFAIDDEGVLWAIGNNQNGCLGLGDTTDRTSLTRVGAYADWIDIRGYYYTTYGIRGV